MSRETASSLGIIALLGGILFPTLLLLVSGFLTSGSGSVLQGFVGQAVFMTFVCFLVGVFGLYLAQQEALGTLGTGAAAIFAAGLALTVFDALLTLFGMSVPFESQLSEASFALLALGAITFGIATARADVLAHARLGGAMLAVALPMTFVGSVVLDVLGIESAVLAAFFIAAPFGAAWVVLGFDLATMDSSPGVESETVGSTHG